MASQSRKFASVVVENLPEIPSDIMQQWIESPMMLREALKNALSFRQRYMIATEAYHSNGDISRHVVDGGQEETCCNVCYVESEIGDSFFGRWFFGLGFFNVRFPKASTREITEKEREDINRMLEKRGRSTVFNVFRRA